MHGSEKDMLVGWLNFHRETLLLKCDGLTPEQLSERSVPPSSLSLAGLVRHLAEIERTYFRRTFAGEAVPDLPYEEDPFREEAPTDFAAAPDNDPHVAIALLREEISHAQRIIEGVASLEDSGESGLPMRFWLIKTLNECARHNGHADLVRERIDGQTGE